MQELVETVLLLFIISIALGTIGYIAQIVEDFIYEIRLNREIKEMERAKERNKDKNQASH